MFTTRCLLKFPRNVANAKIWKYRDRNDVALKSETGFCCCRSSSYDIERLQETPG